MKMNRRAFLATSAASCATASCAVASPVRGKAEHVISIWLGGGMGQIDSFDPKRK
ncbi:MAG: twin-arginine translocation signal domain-containing protein, partial [Verrucomicrobiia bacterium]